MGKFIKIIFTNFIVIYLLQFAIGKYFDYTYQNSSIFKTNIIFSKSYNISKKDILIFGSSRGLTGYNSQFLGMKHNKTIFNLSTDDTQLPTQLLQLKLMVHRNIKPSIIILDLLPTEGYSRNDLRIMPMIGDKDVDEFFIKFQGKFWLTMQKIFPMYKYSYYNVELLFPLFLIIRNHKYQYRSNDYGDYSYPRGEGNLKKGKPDLWNLPVSNSYEEFKKICKENNILLISFIAPLYNSDIRISYTDIINFSKIFDNNPEYFYDNLHLNSKGRDAYNQVLSDTLFHYIH